MRGTCQGRDSSGQLLLGGGRRSGTPPRTPSSTIKRAQVQLGESIGVAQNVDLNGLAAWTVMALTEIG